MIIVALDPPFGPNGSYTLVDILEKTRDLAYGYKVGLPLILDSGIDVISKIKKATGSIVIVDLKLADIGDIMVSTAIRLHEKGADGIIAHGFIGVENALDKLVEESTKRGIQVILVASMTHNGSRRYIDQHFDEIVEDALKLGVHGIVVPATRPAFISLAKRKTRGQLKIYSPGIGAQGVEPGTAICHGADFEIIGRAITRAFDPRRSIVEIHDKIAHKVIECSGYRESST